MNKRRLSVIIIIIIILIVTAYSCGSALAGDIRNIGSVDATLPMLGGSYTSTGKQKVSDQTKGVFNISTLTGSINACIKNLSGTKVSTEITIYGTGRKAINYYFGQAIIGNSYKLWMRNGYNNFSSVDVIGSWSPDYKPVYE